MLGPTAASLRTHGCERELHGGGYMLFLTKGVLCTIEIPFSEAVLQND
jgi:hypothetical protein